MWELVAEIARSLSLLGAVRKEALDGSKMDLRIRAWVLLADPRGPNTNMMVYGPGGYRFGDYARLGWVLTVVVVLAALLMIPIVWPLGA